MTLTGTTKQIEVAQKIRDEKRAQMENAINTTPDATDDQKSKLRATFDQICEIWDATDWLENSRMSGAAIGNMTVKNGCVRLF